MANQTDGNMNDATPPADPESAVLSTSSGSSAEVLTADQGNMDFPVDALPETLQSFVLEGAKSMHCPVDYIGVPLLVSLGAAFGRTCEIEIKNGFRQPSTIWAIIIGDSGAIKTPAFNYATRSLTNFEFYGPSFVEPISDSLSPLSTPGLEVDENKLSREIVVTNFTVEALERVMMQNARGIILVRDELSGWLCSMNQYRPGKQGSDEQFYLSAYSCQPYKVNRVSLKEPIVIPEMYLAITGGIQPKVLTKVLDVERQDTGFAARFLMAYPNEKDRRFVDDVVDDDVRKKADQVFSKLLRLGFDANKKPRVLKMSKRAYQLFKAWVHEHNAEINSMSGGSLVLAYNKMDLSLARIALIIQMTRWACGKADEKEVDEVSLAAAIRIIEYFKAHSRVIYRGVLPTQTINQDFEWVIAWATRTDKSEFTAKELYDANKKLDSSSANQLLDEMANAGLGCWEQRTARKSVFVLGRSAVQQFSGPAF